MAFSSSPKSRNPGQNSSDVEISTIPMVPLNDGSSLAAHVALYACISGKTGSPHMQAECTAESDLSTEDNWIEHTADIIYTIVEFYLRTISETFPVARYRKALINPRCVKLFYTSRILEREVHHPRLRGIQMMRWEQHASRTIKFPHYIVIAFRGHYYRVQIPIHVHHRDDKQRPHHTFEIQREELLSLIRHIVSGELDLKEKHFVDESVLKEPIDVPSQTSDTTKPTSSSAPKRLPTAPPPPTTAPAISPVTPARNMFPHLYTPSRDIRSYSVLTNLPDAELIQWIERLNSEQLNKHILKAFRECMFVIALDPEKMEADPSNCRIHSDPSEVARRVSRSLNLGHWWLEKSLNLTLYADGALLFRADSALNEDVALQSLVQYVQVKLRLRSEDKKCLVGTGRSSPEGWDASAKETHVPNVMIRSDDGTVTQPSGGTQNKTSTMPTSGVKQTVDLTVSRRSSLANAEAQAAKSATDAKKTTVVNHASSSSAVGPSVIRLPIWLRGAHFSEMEEMVRSATDKRSSHPVWHWMQCRVSSSLSSRTLIALHLPVSPMVCLVVLIAVHQIKWPCVSKHSSPVLKEIITKRVSSQLIHTDDAVPSSEIATGHATRMALIGGAATQRLVSLFSCEEKHMIRVPVMAQAIIDACAEITDLREKCTQDLSSGQKVDFTPDPANLLEYQVLIRAVDELPVLGDTSDARAPALSSAVPFYSPAMNTLHVCYAQRCSDNIEWLLTTGLRVENRDTEKKRMEELVCEMNRVSNEMVGFIRYDRHVKYGEALSGRKNASK